MQPIRTEAGHDAALYSIDSLMGTPQDLPEAEKLEDILALVNACQAERWQVEAPAKWKLPAELLVREHDLVDQPFLGGRG